MHVGSWMKSCMNAADKRRSSSDRDPWNESQQSISEPQALRLYEKADQTDITTCLNGVSHRVAAKPGFDPIADARLCEFMCLTYSTVAPHALVREHFSMGFLALHQALWAGTSQVAQPALPATHGHAANSDSQTGTRPTIDGL